MRTQPTRVAVGVVALLLLLFGPAIASAQPAHAMEAKGAPPNHGSLSFFPWEHIDGFTGNAVLSFQDLILPGPGGFNLVVTRTYNTRYSPSQRAKDSWLKSQGYPVTVVREK